MKQRYELGVMDYYPAVINGTNVEHNPSFSVTFKKTIDPNRLYDSIKEALSYYPLLKSRLISQSWFYLEDNDLEFTLIHSKLEDRPKEYGPDSNEFPWQASWHDKTFFFEWCHGATDGRGAFAFFKDVIRIYCGFKPEPPAMDTAFKPGIEAFYDKSIPGAKRSEKKGFTRKSTPYYLDKGYSATCHVIELSTEEILRFSRENAASPSTVIAPIMCRSIRQHMVPGTKAENVTCNIPVDCRVPMDYNTMHNCIIDEVMVYSDKYDRMSVPEMCKAYRVEMKEFLKPDSIRKESTAMVDFLSIFEKIKLNPVRRVLGMIIAKYMKHTECNISLSYIGKVELPDDILEYIEDMHFTCWPDFGECMLSCLDFNGRFILDICENFVDKSIIQSFIDTCNEHGLQAKETRTYTFTQANYRIKRSS